MKRRSEKARRLAAQREERIGRRRAGSVARRRERTAAKKGGGGGSGKVAWKSVWLLGHGAIGSRTWWLNIIPALAPALMWGPDLADPQIKNLTWPWPRRGGSQESPWPHWVDYHPQVPPAISFFSLVIHDLIILMILSCPLVSSYASSPSYMDR
ncbi:hypothetical protein ABZP36_021393 [Zizania latifolia]